MADRLAKLIDYVQREQEWMRSNGWTEEGYIKQYGSKNDQQFSGSGGEAIFVADRDALERHQERLRAYAHRAGQSLLNALPAQIFNIPPVPSKEALLAQR